MNSGRQSEPLDKALMEFRGKRLIDHVFERIAPQVGGVMISANRNHEQYKSFGVRVVSALPETWLVHLIRMAEEDPDMILVRLAKEEYALQEMAGASVGAEYGRKTWGPLSTTFYDAVQRAIEKRWLVVERYTEETNATSYALGPDALDAIEIAFQVIGDRDQAVEEVLHFLEGDATIEAERQATVHKAWADLVARDRPADQDAVVADVQAWKPDRPGFTVGEIRVTYQDLRKRGYIR